MPNNYILLERIELNASASSVTFANIPQSGYTDLKIVASTRNDYNGTYVSGKLYFNGGGSGTYTSRNLDGEDGSAYSNSYSSTQAEWGPNAANQHTANVFTSMEFYFPNYTSSAQKSWSIDGAAEQNATTMYALQMWAGSWNQTAAISSITLTGNAGNFMPYSTFSLYGLAAVGTTPAIAPKASGGNITTDGTYWYHTFLSSGTFTPATALTCDVLEVAGGAGGGGNYGGGGGAGGYVYLTNQAFTATSNTVLVGAGGVGGDKTGAAPNGYNGTNSQVGSLTAAIGGGGGAYASSVAGSSGGSGGGGHPYGGTYGAGTSGQGNRGGAAGSTGTWVAAGGGGGAGAVGGNGTGSDGGTGNYGGPGGAGINTYSSLLAIGSVGTGGYICGGGGGGGGVNTAAAGGVGGGGVGGMDQGYGAAARGGDGTVFTGGGGGGGGNNGNNQAGGGNGGSGFVIIKYSVA